MSEHSDEQAPQAKSYPGALDRYAALKGERSQLPGGSTDPNYAMLCVAEELAGLAYILDGIRYTMKQEGRR